MMLNHSSIINNKKLIIFHLRNVQTMFNNDMNHHRSTRSTIVNNFNAKEVLINNEMIQQIQLKSPNARNRTSHDDDKKPMEIMSKQRTNQFHKNRTELVLVEQSIHLEDLKITQQFMPINMTLILTTGAKIEWNKFKIASLKHLQINKFYIIS